MLKNIIVEIPTPWLDNPIDGLRNREFISNFLIAVCRFNIPVSLISIPFGADQAKRVPEKGTMLFSYHSNVCEVNVWHLKEAPVIPFYSIDKSGYSGWSFISKNFYKLKNEIFDIDIDEASKIIAEYDNFFKIERKSKYPQKDTVVNYDSGYVFFPLQVQSDPVSDFSRLPIIEVIKTAAFHAEKNKVKFLIKRHPFCDSTYMQMFLDDLSSRNKFVILSDDNIHDLCINAKCVLTVNSGVGIEALIHGIPVYSIGDSEWALASSSVITMDDIEKVFTSTPPEMSSTQKKIVAYLLSRYWVRNDDFQAIENKIAECIRDFDDSYGDRESILNGYQIMISELFEAHANLNVKIRDNKRISFDNRVLEEILKNKDRCLDEKNEETSRIVEDYRKKSEELLALSEKIKQKDVEILKQSESIEKMNKTVLIISQDLIEKTNQIKHLTDAITNREKGIVWFLVKKLREKFFIK